MGHVWLIGMMGSGKTSVGRGVASRREQPFYDTDAIVEAGVGASIPEIFERDGEDRFRELERSAVGDVSTRPDGVVATGGGIVLDPRNVADMRAGGVTVLLSVSVDTLVDRIRGASNRPLLPSGRRERLREIADARGGLYDEAADIVVDADGPLRMVVDLVEAACAEY